MIEILQGCPDLPYWCSLVHLGYGFFKRAMVYEAFIEGAKEGLNTPFAFCPIW